MSTITEISAQPTTDPNVKAYHSRYEMSSGPESGTRGNCEDLGEFGRMFLEIRGVVQVHVCPYTMLITKGHLFEWEEMTPHIESILKNFVASQRTLLRNVDGNNQEAGRIPGVKGSQSVETGILRKAPTPKGSL